MRAPRKYTFARMTVDEFLSWDPKDRSRRRWQLMDGEPVAMAPATDAHGSIQAEIGGLIREHLLRAGMPCRVVMAPGVIPHIGAKGNFRIPDLGVTCAPPSRDANLPAPLLLIEILSPSNERDTRSNVWTYTTIPSVREILTVRSTRIEAELLRRLDDGTWPDDPRIVTGDAELRLDSIGFGVPLSAFYRTAGLA